MKNRIKIVAIGVMALTVSSCSDFLDTYSPSKSTPELVFDNRDMAEKAVIGVYDILTTDNTYSQDLSIFMVVGTDIEIRTHGSVANGVADINTDRQPCNYLADQGNAKVQRVWNSLYQCIERANIAIERFEASEAYKNPKHQLNAEFRKFRAECIALRALCYQDLTRNWGNVPFKLESTKSDLSNVYLPKTDRFVIWETLVNELIACADDLPWYNGVTTERVTQGYARGLAARLALYRAGWDFKPDATWAAPRADANEYYQIAKDQCDIVMQSGKYGLEDTFESYFYKQCQKQYSQQESLFEVGFAVGKSSEMGYSTGVRFSVSTPTYGYATQGTIVMPPSYYFSFHPEDTRRDVTVSNFCYNGPNNQTSGTSSDNTVYANIYSNSYDWRLNKWPVKWASEKFKALSWSNVGTKSGTGINFPLMRYSDVLLMFAEADFNLNGETAAAKQAFWEVRHRGIPTLTRGQFDSYVAGKGFISALQDERMWEFGGEAMRKYDLIRWGILVDKLIEMREVNDAIINNWTYTFEFPLRADGKPRALPTAVYYKLASDPKYPNMFDLYDANFDYVRASQPNASYESSNWIYNSLHNSSTQATNRVNASAYWHYASSGCVDINNVPVANGRPFFPIPGTVITDYNGKLVQDYGFVF